MDRNLGALDDKYHGTSSIKSKYYQFGRKDPFNSDIFCWTYDAQTLAPTKTASANGAVTKISKSLLDDPDGQYKTNGKNVPFSVNNPEDFIYAEEAWTLGDIFNPNPMNSQNVWQDPYPEVRVENEELITGSSKSFFDPCPLGWRITRYDVFSPGFFGDSSGSATGNTRVNCPYAVEDDINGKHRGTGNTYFPSGYLFEKTNPSPQTAFFPYTGYRNVVSSFVPHVEYTQLWCSDQLSVNLGDHMLFARVGVGKPYPTTWNHRVHGYSIRCIKNN